ncbi:MAG: branched-chain amino acid ABC transporter permease [Oscillospiraceae bacterium]|nr:branched-chain amino acid ABC transporter permease [Oscillospiraceae bacterium]
MKAFISKNKWTLLLLIAATALMLVLAQKTYYALIIALFGIYAIVATSLDVLFGYTGQISLGHAGLFAIGAYSSALLTIKFGVPSLLSLVLGSAITALIGALIAIPASKLVKHFLSLLMIAFGQIIYLIINSWTEVTGGSLGIMNIPYLNVFGFEVNSNLKGAIVIWVILAIVLLVKHRIIRSRVGNAFIAIRENTVAARGLGIDVQKYKVLAFAVSAAMTGLAGGLYAFLRGFISPETFNGTQSVLFMTMLLFGGITTLAGPVIGAIVLLLFKEVFQTFSTYQGLIYALFMLLVLFFFPNGIIGLYKSGKTAVMKLLSKRAEATRNGGAENAEN